MSAGASSSAVMMPTGPPEKAIDRLDVRLPFGTHLRVDQVQGLRASFETGMLCASRKSQHRRQAHAQHTVCV